MTVVLLFFAITAVEDRPVRRRKVWFVLYAAAAHTLMAVVKIMAFMVFIIPGIYLYVKLFFVPLIMLEHEKGLLESIKLSFLMTKGSFWHVLAVVIGNSLVQLSLGFSIIGLVPATAFAHTARAAAFHMLGSGTRGAGLPPPVPEGGAVS
jgi:hypothetical protein